MSVVSGSVSVGAGATSANVLSGRAEGNLMNGGLVSVRANHAGAARTDINTRYSSGITPRLGEDGSPTNVAVTAGVLDARIDTLLARQAVIGVQSLRFVNSTAGALVVQYEYELHSS